MTPPSLAPQWADELATHAPDLKVLVYEGWQKVPVPITEKDVALEREKRQKEKRMAKIKGKSTTGKRKGKAKAKMSKEDEGAMDIDDDNDEEDDEDVVDWCTYVSGYDVVITTYNILQQDLGVARPPPVRPRRSNVQYSNLERSRSPLIMCEWYRVIMDEVQMAGGGKTEYVYVLYLTREGIGVLNSS